MQITRYIRAYHKQTESLAFAVQLPSDCLTFLSTVDFLQDDVDPLLYSCYELTKQQCDYLFGYWHLLYVADTDYFDYFLECDSIHKVKTQKQLFVFVEQDCVNFVTSITGNSDCSSGIPAAYRQDLYELQELCYKIYQQGVEDERL